MKTIVTVKNDQVNRSATAALTAPGWAGEVHFMDAIDQIWERVRETIEARLSDREWSRRTLARRTGIPYSTLGDFLSGRNATLGSDKLELIEREIGQIVPGSVTPDPLKAGELRLIPVVSLANVPLTLESASSVEGGIVARIHRQAEDWEETDRPDPGLFAVRVDQDSWSRFRKGDRVLVSPDARPKPGDFVVALSARGLGLGRLLEIPGLGMAVELEPGKPEQVLEVVGRAVEHRSPL